MNYIAIIFVGFYSVLNMCSHVKSLKIELYPIFRSVFCLKLAKMFSKFVSEVEYDNINHSCINYRSKLILLFYTPSYL